MDIYSQSLKFHKEIKGKIDIISKVKVNTEHKLSLAYTPGVAEPCRRIAKDPSLLNAYTSRGNMIAVVTDGSAVLGLGNIGPRAALPVMEGKCALFKEFGGVAAFPICIDSQSVDEIVNSVKLLEPSFSGINLEDISAPRCFYIEERLKGETDMLIFHDDQHGTAIIVLAGLINALKLTGKDMFKVKIVVNGAGAAGTAIAKLLKYIGVDNIIICDSRGIISKSREDLNPAKLELANITNPENIAGNLSDAMVGSDVFIGVSVPRAVSSNMVTKMNSNSIIFAMANPEPEIKPELAKKCGVKIIATGRSDYPNQINNVLAFPGVFRGALDAKAKGINMDMKVAAAKALAKIVARELRE
ncbi:MAG: NAD-dependent malic enzyme, partial [Actinobacteria bacterium]|nr:NAD-dependent malic enzyme [Actinomycetota bacterium]